MGNPAAEFTWKDSLGLVGDAVKRFRRAGFGRLDDLQGIVHEAFMDAFISYDAAVAEWSTHLQSCIWWALRREAQAKQRRREEQLNGYNPPARESFDVERWVGELSADAQTLVRLALDMGFTSEYAGSQEAVWKAAEKLGWADARTAKAWREVKGAL